MDSRLSRVIDTFHESLGHPYQTRLLGGFAEPEYLPGEQGSGAEIRFREDFISSALHETAHWCIAGSRRRQLHDFGYWYYPEGRDTDQQLEFERAEVRPQAIEWVFSVACGQQFYLSRDNHGPNGQQTAFDFSGAVYHQTIHYCQNGLPQRAAVFASALALEFENPHYMGSHNYRKELLR